MFQYFFQRFKAHFELDRRQAKIHFVLLWISVVVLCSPLFTYYAYPLFVPQDNFQVTIDTLSDFLAEENLPTIVPEEAIVRKPIQKFSEEDWLAVGLPSYLAQRIMKYQAKGAVLKNLKDLSKVYGMNEALISTVKPYVIEESGVVKIVKEENNYPSKPRVQRILDINTTDSNSLIELPGIGPVFAKRIMRYRDLLQGYVSKAQYKEIYGLTPFALEILNKYTIVEPRALGVISNCDYKKLNGHLYLSSKDARYIISELTKNEVLCWNDFAIGLSDKAIAHIEVLQLYFPCK